MSFFTVTRRPTMTGPKLPLDIQLYILDWLILMSKEDSNIKLSTFAGVSKPWQHVVERELFRSLTVNGHDISILADFTDERRHYVKHILLGVWLDFALTTYLAAFGNISFLKSVQFLFQALSTWGDHKLTLELGIISRNEWYSSSGGLRVRSEPILSRKPSPITRLWSLGRPYLEPALWESEALDLLGHFPVTLGPAKHQQHTLLPSVTCVAKLFIRRRFYPNIDPGSLSIVLQSLVSLKAVHIERWCYGAQRQDRQYDEKFKVAFVMPPSVNAFSFYEECGTNYHRRSITYDNMTAAPVMTPRSNSKLLSDLIAAADRMEHIAISFALDASSFLARHPQVEYKKLKTLALTSETMISRTDNSIDALLCSAAEAVKMMPKLEVLEIWYYRTEHVGIFTYRKISRYNSCISCKCTSAFRMSEDTQAAWRGVADQEGAALTVDHTTLDPTQLSGPSAIYPHLVLREQILRHTTWREMAWDPMVDPDQPPELEHPM